MLEKSFGSPADSISYDLEDSVSPGKKADARRMVADVLNVSISYLLADALMMFELCAHESRQREERREK